MEIWPCIYRNLNSPQRHLGSWAVYPYALSLYQSMLGVCDHCKLFRAIITHPIRPCSASSTPLSAFQPFFSVSPLLPFSYLAQYALDSRQLTYRVPILSPPVHGGLLSNKTGDSQSTTPAHSKPFELGFPLQNGDSLLLGPLGVVHSLPTSSDTHLVVFPIRLEQIRALHNFRASIARTHCQTSTAGKAQASLHVQLISRSALAVITSRPKTRQLQSNPALRPCF